MAARKGSSGGGGRGRGGNRGGGRGARSGGNSGGGFPSWGLYALGGLAIAGIIYGLAKYGPTSETLSGWVDSATGWMGGGEDEEMAYGDDYEGEEEGTANAAGGTNTGYGSVQ